MIGQCLADSLDLNLVFFCLQHQIPRGVVRDSFERFWPRIQSGYSLINMVQKSSLWFYSLQRDVDHPRVTLDSLLWLYGALSNDSFPSVLLESWLTLA